jgi:hypothetical protein
MQTVRFLLLALAFLLPCAVAEAQAPTQPPPQTKGAPALMVLNAKTARIDGKTLALDGVAKSAIVFSDRPARRAGYMHLAASPRIRPTPRSPPSRRTAHSSPMR